MIKASGRNSLDLPFLLLGLSGENIARLTAGEPIRIQAEAMTEMDLPPMEIVIHYGRTEQDILDELRTHGWLHEAGSLKLLRAMLADREGHRQVDLGPGRTAETPPAAQGRAVRALNARLQA